DVAQEADRGPPAPEELHERIGEAHDPAAIGRAPLGEPAQYLRRSYITTGAGDHLSEQSGIAQPEVETLAGDRMQRLGGIADEHGALRDAGHRPSQLQ